MTSITNSGKIEESELEERFIKLLSVYAAHHDGYSLSEKRENGTIFYELKISKNDIDAVYWIRPQIVLGPKDGIAYSTRTDFLIVCGSYRYQGQEYQDRIKKVAVYLDGYQYHASEEHNVFERDINIRNAIVDQPEFSTWTLTWEDLNLFQKQLEGDKSASDEIAQKYESNFLPNYTKLLQTITVEERVNYALTSNNVDRILFTMTHPTSIWNKSWFRYLGSWTNKFLEPSFNPEQLDLIATNKLTHDSYIRDNRVKDFNALVPVQYDYSYSFGEWKIWVNMGIQQIIHLAKNTSFEHIDKSQWQFYWSLFNLFQSSDIVTLSNEQTENESLEEWKSEVLEMYDSYLHSLIEQAITKDLINQENADFLDSWLDDDGNILADADFILQSIKIAINPSSQESEKILQDAGFTIYKTEEINTIKL